MPDPHAPSPDALDVALDALMDAYGDFIRGRGDAKAVASTRAALKAFALREPEGEVWAIQLDTPIGGANINTKPGDTHWELHADGCRVSGVRVTRIEEGYNA